ncbi:lamin tail domain-containing protein [Actinocorallia sp. API 0066]|uniref:lamin tail domain-containing protein n=1 Tax=Actinocorallia sp. API 0066 TaxID=2896846 RepID=UPI001E583B68|nr:lamin tail domain-containing protein [Actinocorallia sp. API 0066]MCD0453767.1 lamin tail domain-containing protein [Actinocorallia sp. API 0066]
MATPLAASGRPARFAWLLAALSVPVALLAAPPAHAASADLVIAEVYGGGGNAGAQLKSDFVELANAGSAPFDVTGHSVQYLPANPSATATWQVTPLTGSVAPGGRYLVKQADGSGGSLLLPDADATGGIAMAAGAGTIALVAGTAPLTCKTAADCAADTSIKDLVGYGTAVIRETSPAPTLSATLAAARPDTLADTDDNAADFTAQAPTPVNSKGEGPKDPPKPPTEPGDKRIRDVQGKGRISPYADKLVEGVPGVVTAVDGSGFWIQDPQPDADDATSEGLFVYTGSRPAVAAGDSVLVTGTVKEYRPSSAANQTLTELEAPLFSVLSSGNPLPAPVPVRLPTRFSAAGDLETLDLQPGSTTLDWLEAREGMLVSVADVRVVGATTQYREFWVQTRPKENPSPRGGTVYTAYDDPNGGRLQIHTLGEAPKLDVGDTLLGTTSGPLHYQNFGGYTLYASAVGTEKDGGIRRQAVAPLPAKSTTVGVATYNVENLAAIDDDAKFARLAEGVVTNLGSPEIIALEEIQDDNGALTTSDPVVSAEQTLTRFTAAIRAAGGPAYQWRQIDPVDDQDGGAPGGNIRQVFLFNPERGVKFVDRPGGDSTTSVQVVKGKWPWDVALSASPGRINPGGAAWRSSRKPLVGEFDFRGRKLFVVANHFNSKGGDQPLHGRNQPPVRSSETQRLQQAQEVNAFVRALSKASDGWAEVVVLGDINDYQFAPAMDALTGNGKDLKPLITTLPKNERYSYVFDGNSQALDHILVSPSIRTVQYGMLHINAEFADQASDHDPQLVRLPLLNLLPLNLGLPYTTR